MTLRSVLSSDTYLHRCQIAAWMEHKKSCRGQGGQGPQLPLENIRRRVLDSGMSEDWGTVLRWESQIDELVAGQDQMTIFAVLQSFASAYREAEHRGKSAPLWVRCAEACGALKIFSQQVVSLRRAGTCFMAGGDCKSAALWFESGRDISAEQEFVSMESDMCSCLGDAFQQAGRYIEGLEQHRRALAVAQSVGENDVLYDRTSLERAALRFLVQALCVDGQLEEADTLLTRLREEGDNTADCRLWDHFLGGIFHNFKGNFQEAAEAFQAAVDVVEEHPDVLLELNADSALEGAKVNLRNCVSGAGDEPSLSEVVVMVETALEARDWPGVLQWESRLEAVLLILNEATHPWLLHTFAWANLMERHWAKAASLFQRRVQVLGKRGRFREQGGDMCLVGDCFRRLNDLKVAETWFQRARKLGEEHGCLETECAACLGLGRMEIFRDGRMQEAEELLRHALGVVEFVEGDCESLEADVNTDLVRVLMATDRYEEAGPLIQRLRELAERASAEPFAMVKALEFAVYFQVRRSDVEQASNAMQVLPSDPISHPHVRDYWNPDLTSHLQKPQPAVANETLVLCTCSGTPRPDCGQLGSPFRVYPEVLGF